MKRILYITGQWANGGIEKVITSYCKHIDKQKFQIDIFTFEKEESIYTKEVEKFGVKVLCPINPIHGGYLLHNLKRIKAFLDVALTKYDIIHYHTSFAIAYLHCYLLKRKNRKIKVILHSHGDNVNAPFKILKVVFNRVVQNLLSNVPDYCLACSENAGKWLFSKKVIKSNRYVTLMNAIEVDDYRYNIENRNEYRELWGVANEIIIGTVGRIEYQKNPYFILDIIKKLSNKKVKFKFVWVGTGADRKDIIEKSKALNLDNIIFIEYTDRVSKLLSAFDLFLLPSRYEGLGLVLIEAQISGLLCIISDSIPKEVDITNNIKKLSIKSSDIWCDTISEYVNTYNFSCDRTCPQKELIESGFDIKVIISKLISVYLKEVYK